MHYKCNSNPGVQIKKSDHRRPTYLSSSWGIGLGFILNLRFQLYKTGRETEDSLPQQNEGDNGTRFCAARLVLPVETEALGEAHDNHLGYGQEHKGRHRIWRWNVGVVFAVVISTVGCIRDRSRGGIECPAWVCTCRIHVHIRDGSLQKRKKEIKKLVVIPVLTKVSYYESKYHLSTWRP